jgi:ABC-type Fe3+/spermidine/putrescine transport system ATPase subunit
MLATLKYHLIPAKCHLEHTLQAISDQEEALELADRIVVLRDGRIEQVGTPDEI